MFEKKNLWKKTPNNVKEIESFEKRLRLIQYFKDKAVSTGVVYLQENHSYRAVEQKWKEDFKGHLFLSHRKKILASSWLLTLGNALWFSTEKPFAHHSNLLFKSNKTKFFPSFYSEIDLN